jgi:hypothetical protein
MLPLCGIVSVAPWPNCEGPLSDERQGVGPHRRSSRLATDILAQKRLAFDFDPNAGAFFTSHAGLLYKLRLMPS